MGAANQWTTRFFTDVFASLTSEANKVVGAIYCFAEPFALYLTRRHRGAD
jgi:hypothetical protein